VTKETRPWVEGMTIGAVLRAVAKREGDREAIVFRQQDVRASYAQYDRMVDDAAKGLISLGLGRGDHVAVWSTNRPEWAVLQLATARIGAVLVTLNPAYRAEELVYALEQSGARALFLIDQFKSSDYFEMLTDVVPGLTRSWPGRLESAAVPKLRWVVSLDERGLPGMATWGEMMTYGQRVPGWVLRAQEALVRLDQPALLQYTSGTTGSPKGVLLSHRNVLLNAYYVGICQGLTPEDRVCVPVPFYHCFGAIIGTLASLVHGTTMLIPSEYFDATAALQCMEAEEATAVYGVPTMFISMLEHPSFSERDLSSLRTGVMAGAPCPVDVMKRVMEDMGASEITIGYGLTEASPVITQTRVDDPVERRVETVGRAIPGVQVKILDPETGEERATDEQGELCARGHNVMLGYHAMPKATADAIDPRGWLHSGDLAVLDEDGYVRITGRHKDMIIRGGENIYPREIEEVLHRHPAVEDVQVVGLPDDRLGEEVCAWIKIRADAEVTEDDIRDFLRPAVAHFKIPRYIDFVEAFPLTVTGKVQKYRIREIATHQYGLDREASLAGA
jgi:fatty-acyl-CoA synthase